MGSEGSKSNKNRSKPNTTTTKKVSELTDKDYEFLSSQTRLSKNEIKDILDNFRTKSPLGLDKQEFVNLYGYLRPEAAETLEKISHFAFRCFDKDHNAYISFGEFLISYAITTRGDLAQKLEYAFDLFSII